MDHGYGIPASEHHAGTPHRQPARYLVLIGLDGASRARLFLDSRQPAGDFDAAAEEISSMTQGLTPARDALEPEWDVALAGHSRDERAAAEVYTLAT